MSRTAIDSGRVAYSLKEAAAAVGYSTDHIRRAIRTINVDPSEGVHHLPAKVDSRGQYRITHAALVAWVDQMADAS